MRTIKTCIVKKSYLAFSAYLCKASEMCIQQHLFCSGEAFIGFLNMYFYPTVHQYSDFQKINLIWSMSLLFSSASVTVEGATLEEGGIALGFTEQKINMMVLDICHKPGGSEYLRQIYHIIRLNEVGKRPFYRAIRCVLAWGSVCWQLRVSQGGDNAS